MKKLVKTLFAIAIIAFACASCKPTTSQLEKEVKELASKEFSKVGVEVKGVSLVHKSGNDYSGQITLSSEGEERSFDINVVCDGRTFKYEIPEILNAK